MKDLPTIALLSFLLMLIELEIFTTNPIVGLMLALLIARHLERRIEGWQ